MSKNKMLVNSNQSKELFLIKVAKLYDEHKHIEFQWRAGKQRTLTQNRALHLYCQMLADDLNASGFDIQKTMKENFCIPWTQNSVKELIWRPVQQAVTKHESTAKAERKDYSYIYDIISRNIAMNTGVITPWPEKKNKP